MATSVYEYTKNYMESTKNYMSGFRMPDWKKLWYGQDYVDSANKPSPSKSILIKFERYLVQLQELSLWTNPQNSVAALVLIHLIYWYLKVTQNSTVYLISTLCMVWFVYSTWTKRIWPAIRVPEADPGPTPEWTPVNPDVLSAPEMIKLWDDVKNHLIYTSSWMWKLRQDEPGKFCALTSSVFLVLAYIGTYITTLGLFYYVLVGYLIIPGVMKILVKYPAVQCILETMEDYKKNNKPEITEEKSVKVQHDEIDAAPSGPAESVAPSLVASVYTTFQNGLEAVSNLNLKSDVASIKASDQDDLSPYLPDEEDEINQSILESAISSSTRDPMQAHNLEQEEVVDSSLEYASLLPVTGDLMPDEDELDGAAVASTLPSLTLLQAAASNQAELDYYDDQDEFLPSQARQPAMVMGSNLDKDESSEEEDEFAASLMAVAAKENIAEESISPVIRQRKTSAVAAGHDDIDDFEMISEEELAEVSP